MFQSRVSGLVFGELNFLHEYETAERFQSRVSGLVFGEQTNYSRMGKVEDVSVPGVGIGVWRVLVNPSWAWMVRVSVPGVGIGVWRGEYLMPSHRFGAFQSRVSGLVFGELTDR